MEIHANHLAVNDILYDNRSRSALLLCVTNLDNLESKQEDKGEKKPRFRTVPSFQQDFRLTIEAIASCIGILRKDGEFLKTLMEMEESVRVRVEAYYAARRRRTKGEVSIRCV